MGHHHWSLGTAAVPGQQQVHPIGGREREQLGGGRTQGAGLARGGAWIEELRRDGGPTVDPGESGGEEFGELCFGFDHFGGVVGSGRPDGAQLSREVLR